VTRLLCGQVVQFDVNKEADSTGDFLIHVIVKQGEFMITLLLLLLFKLLLTSEVRKLWRVSSRKDENCGI